HTDEGLRAADRVRREWPGTGILLLSQYLSAAPALALLDSGPGGVGYLLKDRVADIAELTEAVRRVGGGSTVLHPELVRRLIHRPARPVVGEAPMPRAASWPDASSTRTRHQGPGSPCPVQAGRVPSRP
ncbi:MAG TPA: hypothetical protein VNV66_06195, partial [Pilimelia sp.]|nr:hypothetical protein [Pilimelia sp.]